MFLGRRRSWREKGVSGDGVVRGGERRGGGKVEEMEGRGRSLTYKTQITGLGFEVWFEVPLIEGLSSFCVWPLPLPLPLLRGISLLGGTSLLLLDVASTPSV